MHIVAVALLVNLVSKFATPPAVSLCDLAELIGFHPRLHLLDSVINDFLVRIEAHNIGKLVSSFHREFLLSPFPGFAPPQRERAVWSGKPLFLESGDRYTP